MQRLMLGLNRANPVLTELMTAAVILMRQGQLAGDASKRTGIAWQKESSHHQHAVSRLHVPAHFEAPPDAGSLGPTLSPERFYGRAREAYKAVREIPQTIVQLPCYCHCDRGFGHKSLYSCFEDNQAEKCTIYMNEALLAYHLQKEQGLTAPEIREQIIAQYSRNSLPKDFTDAKFLYLPGP